MEIITARTTVDDIETFVSRLDEIASAHGVVIQAFDARYVVDRTHIRRAVDLAARAIDRGEAIADDPGVEVLLYAAGRRQIDRALEMGVSTGNGRVVAVAVDLDVHDWQPDASTTATAGEHEAAAAVADELGGDAADSEALDEYDADRVRSFFDVSERELAATQGDLADIVHERVALLVVER